jgi:hypothetical protein
MMEVRTALELLASSLALLVVLHLISLVVNRSRAAELKPAPTKRETPTAVTETPTAQKPRSWPRWLRR